ncbi:hypothetical protein [Tissierella praeacuta]|uniref:hypothetical protein n=1 Tax=Tissierella praeacuta TaxID=43131 RepID=UPI00333E1B68
MKKLILKIVIGSMIWLCGCGGQLKDTKEALDNDSNIIVDSQDSSGDSSNDREGEKPGFRIYTEEAFNTDTSTKIDYTEKDETYSKLYSELYNDDEKIVEDYDSFIYFSQDREGKGSEFKMSFEEFSGTNTIMKIECDEKEELALTYNTEVNSGELKLVFINSDNEIETIVEGDGSGDYITTLKNGNYRVKAAGKYAKGNVEIKADTNANVVVDKGM